MAVLTTAGTNEGRVTRILQTGTPNELDEVLKYSLMVFPARDVTFAVLFGLGKYCRKFILHEPMKRMCRTAQFPGGI